MSEMMFATILVLGITFTFVMVDKFAVTPERIQKIECKK